jgi:alpha-glucoside transport system permease protein
MLLKIANAVIAVTGGVAGVLLLFYVLNAAVERLPERAEQALKPYVFVGPAMLVVGAFLVYPTVQTAFLSFAGPRSEELVGFGNYVQLFGDPSFRETLVNNLLWIIVVPTVSLAAGLAVAVLADRLRPRAEQVSKSIIFLPMAISFVGASTIWSFVYATRPAGTDQIGLLNAVVQAFGFDPVAWLQTGAFNLNDFLLMAIMIWLQAGFAMVLLSAAIKGVPDDTIEAARIDGAKEAQIFWRVVVPQIRSTMVVVFTTILILVMKVFDIVYVMTGGLFGTDVLGVRFFNELFQNLQNGRAAAVVVVLLIAVIPVMIVNVRRFRAEEAMS